MKPNLTLRGLLEYSFSILLVEIWTLRYSLDSLIMLARGYDQGEASLFTTTQVVGILSISLFQL
jgi:hypothetical protein